MATDTAFLNRILVACSRGPVRLFRNSVGLGWVGKSTRFERDGTVAVRKGDVIVRNARPLHAGLATGSGDLIGFVVVEVTPAMIGRRIPVFASVEAKEGTGRLSSEQAAWRDMVRSMGGVADEVRSIDDARALLDPSKLNGS